MKNIDGVNAWSRSCDLAVRTYQSVQACNNSTLRDHITRASVSVASSIAGGYELDSPQQICEHLKLARSCCAEFRTHLYVAAELAQIDTLQANALIAQSLELSTLLDRLISACNQPEHHRLVDL